MGEIVRLICVAGGLPFKDNRWDSVQNVPKSPLGQMPTLSVDGVLMGSTVTLARTCAKLAGLYPEDPVQSGISDMVVDHTQDIHTTVTKLQYDGAPGAADTKRTPEAELKKKMANFTGETLPKMWSKLEAVLDGKTYFAADTLTWADVAFFNRANAMMDHDVNCLEAFPNLKALHGRVRALPEVDAWINKYAALYPNQL